MGEKFKKILIKVLIGLIILCCTVITIYGFVVMNITINNQKKTILTIESAFNECDDNVYTKYDFMDKRIAVYIESLCKQLNLDTDLVFAILIRENNSFNINAMNKNENGTVDVGLFQINDKYLWTDFKNRYWIDDIELDPFNWKHNAYIAVHHIAWLQKQLKVEDDVIMAYNCGINAVMNDNVPNKTKQYLLEVNNNKRILQNYNQSR